MDDSLLADFHAVFSVSGDVNAPTRPHPIYASLYKQKRQGFGEQEARRRRMLEQQRARRKDYANYVRKIAAGEEWEEEMEDDENGEYGGRDEVDCSSKKKVTRRVHPYRNQLMLSEWLVDVPEDFEENWYMTVCPIGKRCLVVANKGTTVAYSRSGAQLNCFPSLIPGGCKRVHYTARDYCIMDCIYHESSRTFHVLDLLCWGGHPVCDSDRDFRVYWIRTKLSETKGIGEISRINPYVFAPMDSFSCSRESIQLVLSKPWPLEVDGLLFFHKYCHYTAGYSPLATWLKPHMVTDILKIPVSEEFLSCAPRMSDPLDTPTSSSRKWPRSHDRGEGSDIAGAPLTSETATR